LISENKKVAIIDPGMYDTTERQKFLSFLEENELEPVRLINTHGHLDHVFSNAWCAEKFGLELEIHPDDIPTLEQSALAASMYGLNLEPSPKPTHLFEHDQRITFDGHELEIRHCPGHCPGHVVLISHDHRFVIGGDVLFEGSVGRVDLPGGNAADLDRSIREQLYMLPDDYVVYPGHGNPTQIGKEKKSNYFVFEGGSRLLEGE
jgi:glyoxylase-like metal-dependent hydrolase (beta-lactamase superfamily II)